MKSSFLNLAVRFNLLLKCLSSNQIYFIQKQTYKSIFNKNKIIYLSKDYKNSRISIKKGSDQPVFH